jgi:hypothetical protein
VKSKYIFAGLTAVLMSAHAVIAQTTIADWTFDTTQPTTAGPISPEVGNGSATASGLTSITDTGGNPSTGKSFSGPGWNVGDCWQFQVSTIGFQGIAISFDQEGSATGPSQFTLQYSTDGNTFTPFGSAFSLGTTATKWVSQNIDLSSITALNNVSTVYLRVVDTSTTAINGSAVGSSGTSRIDNVLVTASGSVTVSGPPALFNDVRSTNAAAGRTISLNVVATGSDPLSYQWYYPNLSTPLTDNAIVSGSTSATLTLNGITTNQAGNYQVIVSNTFGSVTSSIANVIVKMPVATNIAYLRTLEDHVNWAPSDTTNLYTVQGTVTTVVNQTTVGNAEFFIQDGTGGIAVFVSGGSYVPDQGTVVQVTGPLGQFDGLLELNLVASNPDHSVTAVGGDSLPTPQIFNFSSTANISFMEATEGSLVVVSNVYLGSTNSSFAASGNVTLTNLSGQTFTLFIHANSTDIIGQSIPPFATSIIGVLSQFKSSAPYTSGYELDITQSSDLVAGTPPPPVTLPIPLNIQSSGGNIVLTWSDSSFALQAATNVAGPYSTITGAASGFTTNTVGSQTFFRLMHP